MHIFKAITTTEISVTYLKRLPIISLKHVDSFRWYNGRTGLMSHNPPPAYLKNDQKYCPNLYSILFELHEV